MLINLVNDEGYSIARAIKKLNLKLTTARFILQNYKETGSFPMKQFKKNSRMLVDLPEEQEPIVKEQIDDSEVFYKTQVKVEEPDEVSFSRMAELQPMTMFVYYGMPTEW